MDQNRFNVSLNNFRDEGKKERKSGEVLTRLNGCPVRNPEKSLTCGPTGPVCMHDIDLLEKIHEFTREKIPARNVHALGCGVYGSFKVTNDITQYSCAKLFSEVGKETPIFVRFSGIFTEVGDPDTTRDPRGFAIKFYTEEGNWDLLGINTPVFLARDAKVGPDAIHACKRDPQTSMWNATQKWDFVVNHPESLHQFMMVYSDRGTPMSFRYMHGYGCHTFSFINDQNKRSWMKLHIVCDRGYKTLTREEATKLAGIDPNFLTRDLYKAIEKGKYPKWRLCCQIMEEKEGWDNPTAFDPTKVWKHSDYPLIDIGEIELNRAPIDFHAEVEQAAFSPCNLVPGIGLSPDKLLQGRLLIYEDTQRHRVGTHYKQLWVNQPHGSGYNTQYVGGHMQLDVRNKWPHYYPSSFTSPQVKTSSEPGLRSDGEAGYYDWPNEGTDEDYYGQPADLWRVLDEEARTNLCKNIAADTREVPDNIVEKILGHLGKISPDFASGVLKLRTGMLEKTTSEILRDKLAEELME